MTIGVDELDEVLKIFESSDFDELRLETDGLKLHVRRGGHGGVEVAESSGGGETRAAEPVPRESAPAGESAQQGGDAGVSTTASEPPPESGSVPVCASVSGTFYRSPSPAADPFVEVGSHVQAGDSVGLVEVMKLFTSVTADQSGEIVSIVVENAASVESGDVLMYIRPDA